MAFGFWGKCDFSENVDLGIFLMGFGRWEGLQSIGNGCGIQIDQLSTHFEPYEFILYNVHDFDHFGIVFDGLMLLPKGPRTLRECPEGPRTL